MLRKFERALFAVFVAGAIAAPVLSASDQDAAAVPLPAALIAARTIYVVNGGVHERIFTRCVSDLQKWGRYTIIGEPAEADLTMTLSAQPAQSVHNWATGQNYPIVTNYMAITAKGDPTVLHGAVFRGDIKKALESLGKRMPLKP
jgi:hypothetical protein